MRTDAKTIRFYTSGERSLVDSWEMEDEIGPSITPAAYLEDYRLMMLDLIAQQLDGKTENSILSIGSGNAKIEKMLKNVGFSDILCTDVIEDFLESARVKGLRTRLISGFDIRELNQEFDLVLLDGSLGHLTSIEQTINARGLSSFLEGLKAILKENGIVVTSDDEPYGLADIETHPHMPHYRFRDQVFCSYFEGAGFEVKEKLHYPFSRSGVGTVQRRICVFRRIKS